VHTVKLRWNGSRISYEVWENDRLGGAGLTGIDLGHVFGRKVCLVVANAQKFAFHNLAQELLQKTTSLLIVKYTPSHLKKSRAERFPEAFIMYYKAKMIVELINKNFYLFLDLKRFVYTAGVDHYFESANQHISKIGIESPKLYFDWLYFSKSEKWRYVNLPKLYVWYASSIKKNRCCFENLNKMMWIKEFLHLIIFSKRRLLDNL